MAVRKQQEIPSKPHLQTLRSQTHSANMNIIRDHADIRHSRAGTLASRPVYSTPLPYYNPSNRTAVLPLLAEREGDVPLFVMKDADKHIRNSEGSFIVDIPGRYKDKS
jgi:hypothetical protein